MGVGGEREGGDGWGGVKITRAELGLGASRTLLAECQRTVESGGLLDARLQLRLTEHLLVNSTCHREQSKEKHLREGGREHKVTPSRSVSSNNNNN